MRSDELARIAYEAATLARARTLAEVWRGLMEEGVAVADAYADPDDATRNLVDVYLSGDTTTAMTGILVRSGHTIVAGDQVIVWKFGRPVSAGWIAEKK